MQDTRVLLVVSNFAHLQRALIPSMTADFETAFNISLADEKNVCDNYYFLVHFDSCRHHSPSWPW